MKLWGQRSGGFKLVSCFLWHMSYKTTPEQVRHHVTQIKKKPYYNSVQWEGSSPGQKNKTLLTVNLTGHLVVHLSDDSPVMRSEVTAGGGWVRGHNLLSAFGLFPLLNKLRQHLITNHTLLLINKQKHNTGQLVNNWLFNHLTIWQKTVCACGKSQITWLNVTRCPPQGSVLHLFADNTVLSCSASSQRSFVSQSDVNVV